jgi:DNA primase
MDHLIGVMASNLDLTRPEGKSLASEQLLPLIAELENDVEREFYLGKLANLVGISERKLVEMAARLHRTRSEKVGKTTPKDIVPAHSTGDPVEEHCLTLLLQYPELRDRAEGLLPEHFERSENREVFVSWRDVSNADELHQMVGIDLEEHLELLLGKTLPPADEVVWEKALADCIGRLEERRLRLQDDFIASEDVSGIKDGEELDSARLATLQQRTVEVNAELVKKMQERTRPSFPTREDQ